VVCAANDLAALWAARGLAARGLQPLEVVTAEALAYNLRLAHSVTVKGRARTTFTLADGRIFDSTAIRGALNRLQTLPSEHLRGAGEIDRQYAEQELYALFLSWLHGLPGPVLNPPSPQGLSGAWRHQSEWLWRAAQAGLPTITYAQSERYAPSPSVAQRTLIVAGGVCCGARAAPEISAAAARLAQAAQTPLLGLDFHLDPAGRWLFANANPAPDLRLGGEPLLDALAAALQP
jgi:hypothetical protein